MAQLWIGVFIAMTGFSLVAAARKVTETTTLLAGKTVKKVTIPHGQSYTIVCQSAQPPISKTGKVSSNPTKADAMVLRIEAIKYVNPPGAKNCPAVETFESGQTPPTRLVQLVFASDPSRRKREAPKARPPFPSCVMVEKCTVEAKDPSKIVGCKNRDVAVAYKCVKKGEPQTMMMVNNMIDDF